MVLLDTVPDLPVKKHIIISNLQPLHETIGNLAFCSLIILLIVRVYESVHGSYNRTTCNMHTISIMFSLDKRTCMMGRDIDLLYSCYLAAMMHVTCNNSFSK